MRSEASKAGRPEFQDRRVVAQLDDMLRLRHRTAELCFFPKKLNRSVLAGGHHSRFLGRGMDFAEVRLYQPGDDVRLIDWRVTARTRTPHTKVFEEERERPVLIAADLRRSMFFGSSEMKSVTTAKIASLLAWAGLDANDRVGGLVFGSDRQYDIRSKRSRHTVLRLLQALNEYSLALTQSRPENLALTNIVEECRRVGHTGSSVFIVSDFHDLDRECEKQLFQLSRHCDLNLCWVYDDLERRLPPPALYRVTDGQRHLTLDCRHAENRQRFEQLFRARLAAVEQLTARLGAGLIRFPTGTDVADPLREVYGRHRNHKSRCNRSR